MPAYYSSLFSNKISGTVIDRLHGRLHLPFREHDSQIAVRSVGGTWPRDSILSRDEGYDLNHRYDTSGSRTPPALSCGCHFDPPH